MLITAGKVSAKNIITYCLDDDVGAVSRARTWAFT